ncbi:MAG: zinc-dependent alcohol dehydrogenase family protein [Chitinispirillaceae bacterium]|nr:zinc-dependent alcohol dehydrogenase family protein [Chitinispirillaceae bacterium]
MNAMIFEHAHQPLKLKQVDIPEPSSGQLLIKVSACGVCRTDLHIVDGELDAPKLPLIPGHQIVGTIVKKGAGTDRFSIGDKVGVPWLGWTCGTCRFCASGRENLCDNALFTGYTINGGFAGYAVADQRYCFAIPAHYPDTQAAPLLCAGLIGYRAYSFAKDATAIGIFGFGAAAHIITQIAVFQGKTVFAFTRTNDSEAQEFARSLGAVWAGASDGKPPELLDAAIIFAPAGDLVPRALEAVVKGGSVICAGIHMSDIPSFPYHIIWGERTIRSVANLTRKDGIEFMNIAPQVPVRTTVHEYALKDANRALDDLRKGAFSGAAVLVG